MTPVVETIAWPPEWEGFEPEVSVAPGGHIEFDIANGTPFYMQVEPWSQIELERVDSSGAEVPRLHFGPYVRVLPVLPPLRQSFDDHERMFR